MKVTAMNVPATTTDLTVASRRPRLASVAFGLALGLLTASASWAQLGGSQLSGATNRAGRANNIPEKPPERSPDAIPGAKAREPAAPAVHPAGDMQPTDALFDAINRGDIVSARDAINRGADMNGVNILGMTPMELSVDLGRNDISFLLLSLRGEDSGRGSRAIGRDTPPSGPADKTVQAGKPAAPGKAAAAKTVPAKSTGTASGSIPARPLATPKLFANDGGAPVPNAGFLGFGSRSASN